MTFIDLSLSDESTPTTTQSTLNPNTTLHWQDAGAGAAQVSRSETTQEMQQSALRPAPQHGYTPSVAISSTHKSRAPRAAAKAANAVMAQQVQEEEASLGFVMAKAFGDHKPSHPQMATSLEMATFPEMGTKRPSRAAAVAASAGMALQALEEDNTLGMLMSAALVTPMDQSIKKRPTETEPEPPIKKTKITKHNTVEIQSTEQHRGKKRRQAPVYEPFVMEASPIITDLPPLPFTTTTPELKGKKKHAKKKMNQVVECDSARECEFCKKVANICVQMHCQSCRRVYHAGCFLHAFKPYLDEKVPVLDQMEKLQLAVPDRRGNILRCASCKAAFLDFYETGGYLWDCDCPSCTQPEKLIHYRQRKLVQMMNDMELEKQRSREKKSKKKSGTVSASTKAPPPAPSRSNSVSRSRRTRSVTPDQENQKMELKPEEDFKMKSVDTPDQHKMDEPVVQVSSQPTSKKQEACTKSDHIVGSDQHKNDEPVVQASTATTPQEQEHRAMYEPAVELDQQKKDEPVVQVSTGPTLQKQEKCLKYEPLVEPEQLELSGDELVNAVGVVRDDKGEGWCYTVMCSRTANLHTSGIMKTGKCTWFKKKLPVIQCGCCNKDFGLPEFVHHTDSNLVKDAKCASEDPMPFLFVQHHDSTQHTPLDKFLPAFRKWVGKQSANNTPPKSRGNRALKKESPASGFPSTLTTTNSDAAQGSLFTALSRLQTLALFKRPKHRSEKTSIVARLSDAPSSDLLAQVVCISPKYVMNMHDGSLVDRVVRSMTPDSFPRKAGWLAFNRKAFLTRHITCVCCEKSFSFDEFVVHTGISLMDAKAREFLYVVERIDDSALVPFKTFLRDLETAKKNSADQFLDELRPPTPPPIAL